MGGQLRLAALVVRLEKEALQMDVAPASLNQVLVANDGRVYELDKDASVVAADLAAIDAGLKVRFSERGECWIIYHRHHPGCPHNGTGKPGSEYLIRSVQAYQTRSGVWAGLDQRIVDRIRFIQPGGRSGYDYAGELERGYWRAREASRRKFHEQIGEAAERTAHEIRRATGERYRGRSFIPRAIDG